MFVVSRLVVDQHIWNLVLDRIPPATGGTDQLRSFQPQACLIDGANEQFE
jgi:hypothetical protein